MSHQNASWGAGVSLPRSHWPGCHDSQWGVSTTRCPTHTLLATTCPGRKEGEKSTPIRKRSPFFLQWPCSTLYWQNLPEAAKVKYLQGPPPVLQSRPRRMDLELISNKLITGDRCSLFDIKSASPAFLFTVCMIYLFPSMYSQPVCVFIFKMHFF